MLYYLRVWYNHILFKGGNKIQKSSKIYDMRNTPGPF